MAKMAIENNLSLRELANAIDVSYTTLYSFFTVENLGLDLYQQVLNLYSENKAKRK